MKIIYLFIIFVTFLKVNGQVIPAERRVDWRLVNEHYYFFEPQTELNILDFGGDGSGVSNNSSAMEQAIEQSEGKAVTIFFPPGDYLFNTPINLSDSIVIKGAGSTLTTLLFDLGQDNLNAINITGTSTGKAIWLDGGFTKNSIKIFSDSAFLFSSGDFIELSEDNGDWDVVPASWATRSVGQMMVIDSVSGDTIYLQSPLRIDYDSILHPTIKTIIPAINVGINCLKIKRLDQPENGGSHNIYFNYARNCRITGIESDSSVGSHVYISKSLSIIISGCYFHHAFQYDGAATHGYGVTLAHHSSECLVENNVFNHLRHAMMVKTGANGNIFAYNYSRDPYRTEPIHDLSGDLSLHGHYAYANLFESNVVQNIIIDHYWGPSGPDNTLFRNRAERWGIIMTNNDLLETSYQNFVGNETTDFNLFYGQYVLTGDNHFQYGNNILNVTIPGGTGNLTDSSYYLESQPVFWDISDIWPSIGYPNTLNAGTIPAKERYETGMPLTICFDSIYTSAPQTHKSSEIILAPNPNNGRFRILVNQSLEKATISIVNILGTEVYRYIIHGEKESTLSISNKLPPGIYWVALRSNNKTVSKKMIIYSRSKW